MENARVKDGGLLSFGLLTGSGSQSAGSPTGTPTPPITMGMLQSGLTYSNKATGSCIIYHMM